MSDWAGSVLRCDARLKGERQRRVFRDLETRQRIQMSMTLILLNYTAIMNIYLAEATKEVTKSD